MEPYSVIGRTDPKYTPTKSVLNDETNDTCMSTKTADMTLQAVFSFPNADMDRLMSVEVILKNVADCASPAWTLFVESDCSTNYYVECSRNTSTSLDGQNSRCEITCMCPFTCDHLFFKYSRCPLGKDDDSEICEVRLMLGDFEPDTLL